ncbi:MAG: YicC family protein [Ancalomicrobiaceae bacterium]|nr:YicC family protein [Ancalomicrobiaceae bacterium]
MGLQSMTGFARTDGSTVGYRWTWELRSVNGKGLDIRLRLPSGYERIEIPLRERIGKRFSRGSCSLTLTLARESSAARLRINEDVLDAVVAAMNAISLRIDATAPTLDGILAIKGVVEAADPEDDPQVQAQLDADVLAGLEAGLEALAAARMAEGEAIAIVLRGHLARIASLTASAENCPARRPDVIRERLQRQIEDLVGAVPALDPQRLYQEAVLIATKADIREELDRLKAHLAQARQLVDGGGVVGRRLDFLAQEFNRETNTLCSKSNDKDLTAIGLELKASVDQFREQIQNIE